MDDIRTRVASFSVIDREGCGRRPDVRAGNVRESETTQREIRGRDIGYGSTGRLPAVRFAGGGDERSPAMTLALQRRRQVSELIRKSHALPPC